MHSQQLIHRDIKSSNFLLDADWHCKLSDFGMAREASISSLLQHWATPNLIVGEHMLYPLYIGRSCAILLLQVEKRLVFRKPNQKNHGKVCIDSNGSRSRLPWGGEMFMEYVV